MNSVTPISPDSVFFSRMRPLLLQGHERSLTQIRYNREGDLLFSCSKDKSVCVWYIDNGERLGTYEGHQVRQVFFNKPIGLMFVLPDRNDAYWVCDCHNVNQCVTGGSSVNLACGIIGARICKAHRPYFKHSSYQAYKLKC